MFDCVVFIASIGLQQPTINCVRYIVEIIGPDIWLVRRWARQLLILLTLLLREIFVRQICTL